MADFGVFRSCSEFCLSRLDIIVDFFGFVGLNLTKLPILPFLSVLNRQKNKNFSFTKFKRVVVLSATLVFLFILVYYDNILPGFRRFLFFKNFFGKWRKTFDKLFYMVYDM